MCGLDKPTLPTRDPNRVEPHKASTSSTHSGSDEKRRLSCDPPVSDRRLTRCDPFRVKLPVMHEKAPKLPFLGRTTTEKNETQSRAESPIRPKPKVRRSRHLRSKVIHKKAYALTQNIFRTRSTAAMKVSISSLVL